MPFPELINLELVSSEENAAILPFLTCSWADLPRVYCQQLKLSWHFYPGLFSPVTLSPSAFAVFPNPDSGY